MRSYVDDCVCVADTCSAHMSDLRLLFQTLRDNNLSLNPFKARIGFPEVDFLGYTVSYDGVRISDSKITAIRAIGKPTSKKSLQRILGLLNFFRRYVANFSSKTQHMRELLAQERGFFMDRRM